MDDHEKIPTNTPDEEEAAVPMVDIVEPPPVLTEVEPEEARVPIAIVNVGHESGVEAAAEKVAANIKENADQIKAMLQTDTAARRVEAQVAREKRSPKVVVEMSKTIAEIAADVWKFAVSAAKSGAKTVKERVEEASVNRENQLDIADTQERSDAIAATIGTKDADHAPVENINVTKGPNPQVEGFPKHGETEASGVADDLTKIDGVGPKIAAALKKAGFDTFAALAEASEDELHAAIHAAGLRFAPSLSTWAAQARYAEQGEWEKLLAYQKSARDKRRATM